MKTPGLVFIYCQCVHPQSWESTALMSLIFHGLVTLVLKSGTEIHDEVGSNVCEDGGFRCVAYVPDIGKALVVLTKYFAEKPWNTIVQIGWFDKAEFYVRDHFPQSPERPLAQILTDLPTVDPAYENE